MRDECSLDLSKCWLFHFTAIENLSDIIKNGLICDANLLQNSYKNSGNIDIKNRRKQKRVPFGGFVADYVPFYFAARSPMLYTQYVKNNIDQCNIVYLVTTVARIIERNSYYWCCSDMNAAKVTANFYNTLGEMEQYIRWDYMKLTWWNNTDAEPERMERRMAEFLVHSKVFWDDILHLAVYNKAARDRVSAILGERRTPAVHVWPQDYF